MCITSRTDEKTLAGSARKRYSPGGGDNNINVIQKGEESTRSSYKRRGGWKSIIDEAQTLIKRGMVGEASSNNEKDPSRLKKRTSHILTYWEGKGSKEKKDKKSQSRALHDGKTKT